MRIVLIFLCASCSSMALAQSYTLSGAVRDARTHETIPGAMLRIAGTNNGTISNRKGNYKITLPRGLVEISATFMGYATQKKSITLDSNQTIDFFLTLSPVQLGSATVYAKNAEAIIRQAIAEKMKTLASLHNYQFDAYTKTTLFADQPRTSTNGSSVSIGIGSNSGADSTKKDSMNVQTVLESFSTGYWREEDGLREVVKQRRQTANIPQEQNLNAVFVIYNFNDDEQKMGKYVLTGPTAPDALDVYNYELLDVTSMFGRKVYRLRMTPKSDVHASWDGIISIADSTWNVVEVDVRPNSVVNFPFVDSLRYAENFMQADSTYWMPTNIVISANVTVNLLFMKARLQIEHASVLSNYLINKSIPDFVFEQRRITVDSAATKYDTAYWKAHEVMPLTADEISAYKEIDSMVKADTVKQSVASSLLGGFFGLPLRLAQPPFTGFSDVYRFNRVEGNALGLGMDFAELSFMPPVFSYLTTIGKISYGFSDKRTKWEATLGGRIPVSKSLTLNLGGSFYRAVDHQPDADFYTTADNTFLALISKTDYRNYFYTEGHTWSVGLRGTAWGAAFEDVHEVQTSAKKNSDFSIFSPSQLYPPNPAIVDGDLNALRVRFHYGGTNLEERRSSAAAVDFESLVADQKLLGGAFTFTRSTATVLAHLRTSSFGFLDARITGGIAAGSLPPQELFATESRVFEFAPFGVMRGMNSREFAGDKLISIAAQENLGDGIFRLTGIPYLQYSGMELMIDGGAAWTDASQAAQGLAPMPINTARQVYFEAGFGINKILTLFRFDITWRLTHRYQSGNAAFTLTAALF